MLSSSSCVVFLLQLHWYSMAEILHSEDDRIVIAEVGEELQINTAEFYEDEMIFQDYDATSQTNCETEEEPFQQSDASTSGSENESETEAEELQQSINNKRKSTTVKQSLKLLNTSKNALTNTRLPKNLVSQQQHLEGGLKMRL